MRENKQPTKYVFAGATRVAQITGSLSSSARVQRLALHAGWNLLSLAVTAADPRGQMTNSQPANLDPRLVFRWDPQGAVWQPVLAGETLAAGAVVLAHSRTNATLTLTGTYTDPTNRPVASGTASFLAGAGLEALPLLAQSANLELWHQDPAAQDWQVHKPNAQHEVGVLRAKAVKAAAPKVPAKSAVKPAAKSAPKSTAKKKAPLKRM